MARKSTDLKRVEARDIELGARIGELERELEALRNERQKIQIAREVLQELSGFGMGPESSAIPTQHEDVDLPPATSEEIYAQVQEHVDMTIGAMALQVLRSGPPEGLTSHQILDAIQAKSPNLRRSSLSPPLSRLKKRGTIDLVGDRWRLVVAGNETARTE